MYQSSGGRVDKGGTVHVWGQDVYGKSLHLPLNFFLPLKKNNEVLIFKN